ncbi:MAG: glycosyltransferase 87 family protein [Oligoflexia bacterium]
MSDDGMVPNPDDSSTKLKQKLAIAVSVFVFSYWFWRFWLVPSGRLDLEILLQAVHRLWEGQSQYQLSDHAEHTKPPAVAWLLQPLALVPTWVSRAIWDALSWGSLVWLARLAGVGVTVGVGGWLLAAGPWWSEMRLGQYNLLLAALSLGLATFEAASPGRIRSVLLGVGCVFVFLMKPTQILLWPFMISQALYDRRRMGWIGLGALGFLFVLAAGFSVQFGWDAWVAEHLEWLTFLPLSQQKHLIRIDNYGLVTQWVRYGALGHASVLILILGFVGAILSVFRSRALELRSFSTCLLLSIICSPMAWRQNFAPLFLVLSWSVMREGGGLTLQRAGFWIVTLAFSLLASDVLGAQGAEAFGRAGGPLWLAIGAWALSARIAPTRTQQGET